MISISVDDKRARRFLKVMRDKLTEGGRRQFMRRVGAVLRDAVRRRFVTSGDGKWAPLSKWTQAKTGRRKPLMNLRHRIKSRLVRGGEVVEVYFDRPSSEWDINDHHKGNVSPPVSDTFMTFPLRAPAAIGYPSAQAAFRRRRASVTPARRIWLLQREVTDIVKAEGVAYLRKKGIE